MKKFNYIALVLVLVLGLIGGAYAYWTDQLVAEGTVETGNMDVRIDRLGVPNLNGRTFWAGHPNEGEMLVPYVTGETDIVDGGKTASVTIGNIYPSERNAYQNIQLYIKNHSTIPVKLDSVNFTTSGSEYIWNNLKCRVGMRLKDENGVLIPGSKASTGYFDFVDFKDQVESLMDGVVLGPKESIRFGYEPDGDAAPESSITFWLEPGQGNITQDESIGFDIIFNWIQWNAQ